MIRFNIFLIELKIILVTHKIMWLELKHFLTKIKIDLFRLIANG